MKDLQLRKLPRLPAKVSCTIHLDLNPALAKFDITYLESLINDMLVDSSLLGVEQWIDSVEYIDIIK